jgi:hypothetical protein
MPGQVARRLGWLLALISLHAIAPCAVANGHDLPPEIVLQGFLKPEDTRLHLMVRVPLVLLASFSLPKRGPGYLDLANIDNALQQATASTSRQIQLQEDGVLLVPIALKGRVSLLSDRSFSSYSSALAHFDSPLLPSDTNLFWNQGFFDAQLEYTIRSAQSRFSIAVDVAPELGQRLKLRLDFLPVDRPVLSYRLPAGLGWIALDPRWYEAGWLFVKLGLIDGLGLQRFVFLLCLVAPFRQFRSLAAVVAMSAALQAMTCTQIAHGMVHDSPLLAPLFIATLGAAIVLLAIGNLAAPVLRRRWFISAVVGAVGGIDLGDALADALQFAGTQTWVATAAFDLGALLTQLAVLAIALGGMRLLFARVLGASLGLIVLSAVLGHLGWHWMVDAGHEFAHQLSHAGLPPFQAIVPWLVPALAVGAVGFFLPKQFGGVPVPSLLTLLGRDASRQGM